MRCRSHVCARRETSPCEIASCRRWTGNDGRLSPCKRIKTMRSRSFLGKQENLAELYSMSDVKLLLSEKESFGLVLLEAMACRVPCVGTAIGGIPEVIEDGKTAFYVRSVI